MPAVGRLWPSDDDDDDDGGGNGDGFDNYLISYSLPVTQTR